MGHNRDWTQYNQQKINQGKINFWVSEEALGGWQAKKRKKNGHPFVYSDEFIKAISFIRFKFRLGFRQVQGFFESVVAFACKDCKIPSYTQICRRFKQLSFPSELMRKQDVTNIVFDTTGLKVYGEGEWRAEKYGGRRRWKKLHVAIDEKTGKFTMAEITDEHVHDTTKLETALKKANRRKGKVLFDGIADSLRCYQLAEKYNKTLLTPPKKRAVLREEPSFAPRNDAIRIIHGFGNDRDARSIWGKLVGYNQRVIVESAISRWKRLFGGDLRSRCPLRKNNEVQIKAMMINTMIDNELGNLSTNWFTTQADTSEARWERVHEPAIRLRSQSKTAAQEGPASGPKGEQCVSTDPRRARGLAK